MVVLVDGKGEEEEEGEDEGGILLLHLLAPRGLGVRVRVRVPARSCSRGVVVAVVVAAAVVAAAADIAVHFADPIASHSNAGILRLALDRRFFRGRYSNPFHPWRRKRLGYGEKEVAVGHIAMFLLEGRKIGGSREGGGGCSCCWRRIGMRRRYVRVG